APGRPPGILGRAAPVAVGLRRGRPAAARPAWPERRRRPAWPERRRRPAWPERPGRHGHERRSPPLAAGAPRRLVAWISGRPGHLRHAHFPVGAAREAGNELTSLST